jgi:hypothetical protein
MRVVCRGRLLNIERLAVCARFDTNRRTQRAMLTALDGRRGQTRLEPTQSVKASGGFRRSSHFACVLHRPSLRAISTRLCSIVDPGRIVHSRSPADSVRMLTETYREHRWRGCSVAGIHGPGCWPAERCAATTRSRPPPKKTASMRPVCSQPGGVTFRSRLAGSSNSMIWPSRPVITVLTLGVAVVKAHPPSRSTLVVGDHRAILTSAPQCSQT